MYITDLNRDGGIGANSLFVELGPFRLLIDSGLHPKKKGNEAVPVFEQIGVTSVDIIFLTHCHLDHLGSLPVACRRFPNAEVWTSWESSVLAPRMLRNSVRVMSRQREEVNIPEYPLYTDSEIQSLEGRFRVVPLNRTHTFRAHGETLEIQFLHAGHIPGAVSIHLRYGGRSILFSGDILFEDQLILPGAERKPLPEVDTLVLETTRGATQRAEGASRDEEVARLLEIIGETIRHRGSCLLPVFALGRMQEILTILYQGFTTGVIPECPVYTTGLGMDLADYFDLLSKKNSPLRFRRRILKDLGIRKMPREIHPGQNPPGPAIYVVSSGMVVENTPSYRLASAFIEHSGNTICFVGYCDPDAPGHQILTASHGQSITFEALDYIGVCRANVERFDLSSHADRDELLDYAIALNPRAVVLTHGDPEARSWFEMELYDSVLDCQVTDPKPLNRILV